jgi:hypothetical protein
LPTIAKDPSQEELHSSTVAERLWPRFELKPDTGCWMWQGADNGKGYGQIWMNGRMRRVHRIAYLLTFGPLPADKQIDHLCRERACLNPEHMQVVSNRENVARGNGPGALAARTNRCKNGHEFTPENTYHYTHSQSKGGGPGRRCNTCHAATNRAYKQRQKAALAQ